MTGITKSGANQCLVRMWNGLEYATDADACFSRMAVMVIMKNMVEGNTTVSVMLDWPDDDLLARY